MSPATHLLASGVLASVSGLNHRGRVAVMVAGIVPDVDGLGIVPELITRHSAHPLFWFSDFHHRLHNLLFAVIVSLITSLLCRPALRSGLFALASFHMHLLCDLIGARGPDGYSWPIPYWMPFSHAHSWQWAGQWPLNGWQNFVITGILIFATFWLALRTRHSLVELFSQDADARFVEALQRRLRST